MRRRLETCFVGKKPSGSYVNPCIIKRYPPSGGCCIHVTWVKLMERSVLNMTLIKLFRLASVLQLYGVGSREPSMLFDPNIKAHGRCAIVVLSNGCRSRIWGILTCSIRVSPEVSLAFRPHLAMLLASARYLLSYRPAAVPALRRALLLLAFCSFACTWVVP